MSPLLFIASLPVLLPSQRRSHAIGSRRPQRPLGRTARLTPTSSADTTPNATLTPLALELLSAYATAPLYDGSATATAAVAAGLPSGPPQVQASFDTLVSDARHAVEQAYPGISQPGGALHPAPRAAACWRDLRCFLATATAIAHAGGAIRPSAITTLRALYAELRVPLPAMAVGLRALANGARTRTLSPPIADTLDELAQSLSGRVG